MRFGFRVMAAAVLAMASATGASPAAADTARGEALFKRLCAQCHNVDGGRMPITGPTLKGIVGRQAASVEGFRSYTKALRESGITWDAASLDAFLADPKKLVPGTTQTVAVRNAEERAALLAYLTAAR